MLLKEKVALITGAASGIGRSTAQLFAKEGAKVAVVDIDESGGKETVETIRKTQGEAVFISADIGKMSAVKEVVKTVLNRYECLDIVHSNAASYIMGEATEISEENWDRTLEVCLKATWMMAHCALPAMKSRGGGSFITTGSVHAIRGYRKYCAYQAAKGGLLALTRSLAADYAPTIRVNTILPGAVVTGLWTGIPDGERSKIAQLCPLKRNGKPKDIAQAALFLASDMSSYMTGSSLVVDGGLSSISHMPEWMENSLCESMKQAN